MEIEETELQNVWLFWAAWGKSSTTYCNELKMIINVKIEENYNLHDNVLVKY